MKDHSKNLPPWQTRLLARGTLAMCAITSMLAAAETPKSPAAEPEAEGTEAQRITHTAPGEHVVRPSQVVHDFQIPAGSVGDVAAAFEAVTGVKVSLATKDMAGISSPGVTGVLTLEEALTKAFTGTSVAATFVSPEHVSLGLRGAEQEVTVTSADLPSPKYTAALRDLPQTLTVIPESVIENTGSTTLVEALRTVPGITFGAGEGGNPIGDRPFIRGVDSQASTYVDGMRDIGSQSREVFNLESIEVAKGANGTTGGRGTSGGSLNLNTKMARAERFLRGNFSPGSSKFFRGTLDGNMKLTNSIAVRMNGMGQDSGTAGRDVVHNTRYGFAPALSLGLTKSTRANINYYQLISGDIPDPGIPYNNPTFFARSDSRPRVLQAGDGQPLGENVINRKVFYGLTQRDFRNEKVKSGFGRIERDLWEGTMVRNTYRYSKSNQDYIYSQPDDSQGNIYYGLLYRRNLNRNTIVNSAINQTDLAGHFKTGSIDHNFATGMEFSRERGWNNSYTIPLPFYQVGASATKISVSRCPTGPGAASNWNCTDLFSPTPNDPWAGASILAYSSTTATTLTTITNAPVKVDNPTRSRTVSKSLYGFDTVRFMPQLQATVGLRYDHYNASFSTAGFASTFQRTDDILNYQAGVVYKPRTAVSIYGSVNTSAIPSGNALAQGQESSALSGVGSPSLNPEKTRMVETGVKYEAFGSRALLSAAFFQSDTQNVRVPDPANPAGAVIAAGGRRNRGLDTGIAGRISKKWQVFGGYTFMNAIYTDNGVTTAGLPSPVTGTHFSNTPAHSFSITSYYQVTKALSLGGGLYGMTKVWGNESTNKWVPGYTRTDVYGSYRFSRHLELQGNLQNAFNKFYFSNAYTTHYATLAPGRQGRLTLNVLF